MRVFIAVFLLAAALLSTLTRGAVTADSALTLPNLVARSGSGLKDWQVRLLNVVLERRLRFERIRAGLGLGRSSGDACIAARNARIQEAQSALQSARSCKYNGLDIATYEEKKTSCFMRAARTNKVDKLSARCDTLFGTERVTCQGSLAEYQRQLDIIQSDCEDIGRPVPGVIPNCPLIMPLKERLARVTAEDCTTGTGGDGNLTASELDQLIQKANNRIIELLDGTPVPASNDARFPINF